MLVAIDGQRGIALARPLRGLTHCKPLYWVYAMSCYRKFAPSLPNANDVRSDVYALETMRPSLVRRLSPQIRAGLDEYQHLRKTTPVDTPLPRTVRWVESLPPRVRPIALMRQFARIANLIAATWGNLEHFEPYMESLLTDKRGNRKGFPPEVLTELSALEAYRLTIERSNSLSAAASRKVA